MAIRSAVASCRLEIWASAAGRRRGSAAAARIIAASALHCGGVPGAPPTQALKPWSAARTCRFTAPMSGSTAVQKSLRSPAFNPMWLSSSPAKKLPIVEVPAPVGRK